MATWGPFASAILRGAVSAMPLDDAARRELQDALERSGAARDVLTAAALKELVGASSPGEEPSDDALRDVERCAGEAWRALLSITEREKVVAEAKAIVALAPEKRAVRARAFGPRLVRDLADERVLGDRLRVAAHVSMSRRVRSIAIGAAVVLALAIVVAKLGGGGSGSSADGEGPSTEDPFPSVKRGLVVVTKPAGADVFLDDAKSLGASPCAVAELAPGRHVVSAQLAGHEPVERSVEVREGERTDVALELDVFRGTIAAEVNVLGAIVVAIPANGGDPVAKAEAHGASPPFVARLERVPAGAYVVRASKDGFRSAEAKTRVVRAAEARVGLALDAGNEPIASSVSSPPAKAGGGPAAKPSASPTPIATPARSSEPVASNAPSPSPSSSSSSSPFRWLDATVSQANLGRAIADLAKLVRSSDLTGDRRTATETRLTELRARAELLKDEVREALTVVPGKGVNGLVLGVATMEDVKRAYGDVVPQGEYGGRRVEYGCLASKRPAPAAFVFGDGFLDEMQFEMKQSDFHTPGGLRTLVIERVSNGSGFRAEYVGSTKSDMIAELGSSFTTITIPMKDVRARFLAQVVTEEGLDVFRYDEKGIELAIARHARSEAARKIVAFRIFPPVR